MRVGVILCYWTAKLATLALSAVYSEPPLPVTLFPVRLVAPQSSCVRAPLETSDQKCVHRRSSKASQSQSPMSHLNSEQISFYIGNVS